MREFIRFPSFARAVPTAIFTFVLVIYGASPVVTSFDSQWTIPVALSVLQEANTDLDEYAGTMSPSDYRVRTDARGHLRSYFPDATSIIVAPLLALTLFVVHKGGGWI